VPSPFEQFGLETGGRIIQDPLVKQSYEKKFAARAAVRKDSFWGPCEQVSLYNSDVLI